MCLSRMVEYINYVRMGLKTKDLQEFIRVLHSDIIKPTNQTTVKQNEESKRRAEVLLCLYGMPTEDAKHKKWRRMMMHWHPDKLLDNPLKEEIQEVYKHCQNVLG